MIRGPRSSSIAQATRASSGLEMGSRQRVRSEPDCLVALKMFQNPNDPHPKSISQLDDPGQGWRRATRARALILAMNGGGCCAISFKMDGMAAL